MAFEERDRQGGLECFAKEFLEHCSDSRTPEIKQWCSSKPERWGRLERSGNIYELNSRSTMLLYWDLVETQNFAPRV
jgi:hypothetical protein